METWTAFDLARRRMARVVGSEHTGTRPLFDFADAAAPAIDGHHAFRAQLCTVAAGATLELGAVDADQILFVLAGAGQVTQAGEATPCARWDCLAMAAGAPMAIVAGPQATLRLLHFVPDPSAYREAGRQPSVAGAFDASRVARWGQVKGYDDAFVTSSTPGLEKRVFKLLNRGISAGAHVVPALPHEYPFTLSIVEMEAGKGATLHAHATEEIFVALDGDLDLFWGDDARGRLRLAQGEMASIPVGLMRGFRNENGRQFHMLAVVGGWNRQSVASVTYQSAGYAPIADGMAVAG